MVDLLSRLPIEILEMVIDNVTITKDLKSLSEVSKGVRAVTLARLWLTVEIKPRGGFENRFLLHDLPFFYPSRSSLRHTKHLHFRADFNFDSRRRCLHNNCPDESDLEYQSESQDSPSSSCDDYLTSYEDQLCHPRDFDHLTHVAEMIINQFGDNQLATFSWDMGTCIPEGILGPKGMINVRQRSLRVLNLTTDCHCNRDDPDRCEPECCQRSIISLSGLKKLQTLRWRAPHEDDLGALSSAIKTNRKHLQGLELDFIHWRHHVGWRFHQEESTPDHCPFLRSLLQLSPDRALPLFPQLRELSLSETSIGPELAYAVDFEILKSLKLRSCSGWRKFIGKVTELRITPKIKTFELFAVDDDDYKVAERDRAVASFLGTFSGLEGLYLLLADPWFPESNFWIGVAGHRSTLRRCILDGLWTYAPERHNIWGPRMCPTKTFAAWNPFNVLSLDYIGLINEPHCLRVILFPFTKKNCLKIIHIRQGYILSWFKRGWVWEPVERLPVDNQIVEETPLHCTADLSTLLHSVRCHTGEVCRLQEEFCRLVEWAFGPEGIASLRMIFVGDYSPAFEQPDSQICIFRNEFGGLSIIDRKCKQWSHILEEHWDFLQSCPKTNLF